MSVEREKDDISRQAYLLASVRYRYEFGEVGADIIRMTDQYIDQKWMDYDQATIMLKDIFEQDIKDDTRKI